MITIIADPHGYRQLLTGALRAHGPGDYVRARRAVRRALNDGQALTVHVTDQLLVHWLEDLAGYADVAWQRVEPEADYRRIFGADPLTPITAELLVALDIATIAGPPPGVVVEPAGWLLGERVDRVWAAPRGDRAHLTHLLRWALRSADGLAAHMQPLARRCLERWAGDEPVYAALRAGSLAADATGLLRRTALQRYEPGWLAGEGLVGLQLVASSLEHTYWIAALAGLAPAIERYWRERIAQAPPEPALLRAALDQMSGWSVAELRAIEGLLRRNPALIDAPLVEALRRRFAGLPEALSTIDELAALVPPAQPPLPRPDWSDEQWLRWATDDYMPYFAWVVRNAQPREHQAACALAYELWLADRFPVWLTSVDAPLITRQFTHMRDLIGAQPHAVVVWLVVDGLTWWQGHTLRELCRLQQLHPQRYDAGVALLPSLTNISKRALVTGLPVRELPRGSVAHAARELLARAGVRSFVTTSEAEAFEALGSAEPPQCLVLFANTLDRLAHDRADFPDDIVVRGYLQQLAQTLSRMRALCLEHGRPLHVLVGSDHGSTYLPASAPTRRLPQATREVLDVWEDAGDQRATAPDSARAALVNDPQGLMIEQPGDWHYLSRLAFQLPQDYLVPRGYAAVGRRPTGWTHGGLTPEETIVPLIHLAPEPLVIEELRLSLSGSVQARREAALTLQIVNPNPAPLEQVLVQIAGLAPCNIGRLAAGARYETTLLMAPRAVDGAEIVLPWELTGKALGVEHRQQGEARLAVRRLQTDTSFDDMFG